MKFTVTSDPPLESSCQHMLTKEGYVSPCTSRVYLDTLSSTICFKNVRKSDGGIYTISSSNVAGEGEASFTLKVNCEQLQK